MEDKNETYPCTCCKSVNRAEGLNVCQPCADMLQGKNQVTYGTKAKAEIKAAERIGAERMLKVIQQFSETIIEYVPINELEIWEEWEKTQEKTPSPE